MEFEESIWEDDDIFYEKGTLTFQIFHLDPLSTAEEQDLELERVFKDLTIRLRPWIEHYVWDSSPVKFHLSSGTDGELRFVYGELVFGESFQDEWLITSILFDLSKTYQDVYIHVMDNDGEFLLIEGSEKLPEWLSPENGKYRDWINHGRLLIIPEEYYKDRSLRLTESLKFLERAVYRCEKIIEIDDLIIKKVNEYPKAALETQCGLKVQIPRNIAGYFMKQNVLNQVVLEHGKDITDISDAVDSIDSTDLVDLDLRTTVLCYLFIDYYLATHNLKDLKTDGGKLVTKATTAHIKESSVELDYTPSDEEISEFNLKGDTLQKELIRVMSIDKYIEPKLVFEKPSDTDDLKEDELISKLQNFFKDTEADIDGVDNDPEKSNTPKPTAQPPKIDLIDSDNEDEDGGDIDEDDLVREFLKKANIDIDEDDFFEYFAKEALKLTDEELEMYRNFDPDPDDLDKANDTSQNFDGFEDSSDLEELTPEDEDLSRDLTAEDLKSISELVSQFKDNPDGPASTFFQNL